MNEEQNPKSENDIGNDGKIESNHTEDSNATHVSGELLPPTKKDMEKLLKIINTKYIVKNGKQYVIGSDGKQYEVSKRRTFGNLKTAKFSKFRGMYCDTCYLQERCQGMVKGAICIVERDFNPLPAYDAIIGNPGLLTQLLYEQAGERYHKLQMATYFNKKDGNAIDRELEQLRDGFTNDVRQLQDVIVGQKSQVNVSISTKGPTMAELMMKVLSGPIPDEKEPVNVTPKDANSPTDASPK